MRPTSSLAVGITAFALLGLPSSPHAFFQDSAKPCDVHAPRRVEPFVVHDPTPEWHELLSFSQLCYVDRYVRLKAQNAMVDDAAFFPSKSQLYPDEGFSNTNGRCDVIESLIDGAQPEWPVCWGGEPPTPPLCEDFETPAEGCSWDMGFRYPRRETLPGIDYQPDTDSWPVCATADLSVIRSYPKTSECSDPPTRRRRAAPSKRSAARRERASTSASRVVAADIREHSSTAMCQMRGTTTTLRPRRRYRSWHLQSALQALFRRTRGSLAARSILEGWPRI